MQPSDSSLNEIGFMSVLRDRSPLSVDFESSVMNISRGILSNSNIDAYIVLSRDTVVRSGTNLTWGIVGKCIPEAAPLSRETVFVQSDLVGAAHDLSVSSFLRLEVCFRFGGGGGWG